MYSRPDIIITQMLRQINIKGEIFLISLEFFFFKEIFFAPCQPIKNYLEKFNRVRDKRKNYS